MVVIRRLMVLMLRIKKRMHVRMMMLVRIIMLRLGGW